MDGRTCSTWRTTCTVTAQNDLKWWNFKKEIAKPPTSKTKIQTSYQLGHLVEFVSGDAYFLHVLRVAVNDGEECWLSHWIAGDGVEDVGVLAVDVIAGGGMMNARVLSSAKTYALVQDLRPMLQRRRRVKRV